ncbi:MAG: polyprenol monophosphomannose synthase [Thermoplasmata archaeon]|nr:polyprenol monophosphomannose synthase [Thermoplasmata archaeon]
MGATAAFTVVLPTYNERAALAALDGRLRRVLVEPPGEVLVVDDSSPDRTAELVEELGRSGPFRVLRRATRMGLASAVIEGIAHARTDVVAVMDADGSHPPEAIPSLVQPILSGEAQFVLASRHLPGARSDGLSGNRRILSRGAQLLARPLTRVTDPMSGFFAFDRRVIAGADLSPVGYKIALEILVRCRPRPTREVPYVFAPRLAGESKLGGDQVGEYLRHLGRLYAFRMLGAQTAASTR